MMKKVLNLITIIILINGIISCKKVIKIENKEEIVHIIEEKSCKDILNDFFIATNGNEELIARMVETTPEEINNIRTKKIKVSKKLDKKIHDLYLYYIEHGSSMKDLREEFDPEYKFKDKAMDYLMDKSVVIGTAVEIIKSDTIVGIKSNKKD